MKGAAILEAKARAMQPRKSLGFVAAEIRSPPSLEYASGTGNYHEDIFQVRLKG